LFKNGFAEFVANGFGAGVPPNEDVGAKGEGGLAPNVEVPKAVGEAGVMAKGEGLKVLPPNSEFEGASYGVGTGVRAPDSNPVPNVGVANVKGVNIGVVNNDPEAGVGENGDDGFAENGVVFVRKGLAPATAGGAAAAAAAERGDFGA